MIYILSYTVDHNSNSNRVNVSIIYKTTEIINMRSKTLQIIVIQMILTTILTIINPLNSYASQFSSPLCYSSLPISYSSHSNGTIYSYH
jgi:hypothetical protein